MDYELTPVDDAVLALSLFGVTDEDQCRRLLSMWARVGSLTPEEQERVVRAVTWVGADPLRAPADRHRS